MLRDGTPSQQGKAYPHEVRLALALVIKESVERGQAVLTATNELAEDMGHSGQAQASIAAKLRRRYYENLNAFRDQYDMHAMTIAALTEAGFDPQMVTFDRVTSEVEHFPNPFEYQSPPKVGRPSKTD